MRKVFQFMMITADGYFETKEHSLAWHNTDEAFIRFADEQLDEADLLVFGARTYKMMADYWPEEGIDDPDETTAPRMNTTQKLVFSKTMQSAGWKNTTLHHENPAKVLGELKQQPGKDIAVLGSSNLCLSLINEGIIDEIRLMVNPVLLGDGNPVFAGLKSEQKLRLADTRLFDNGNILLTYVPVRS